jgi:hypothetical protein
MIHQFKEKRFTAGTRIKWMQPNQMVDHPEGKTDRKGDMLKVMRTIELTGIIQHGNTGGYSVLPDDRQYTMSVPEENAYL